jgi:hypothetical protein
MLGIGGKFASSKGMVLAPNLIGLTPSAADAAIASSGLRRGSATNATTSTQSQGGKVDQQSLASGTLLDYETTISYRSLTYVAPPPPPEPEAPPYQPTITYGVCETYGATQSGGGCSGQQFCGPTTTSLRRRRVFVDGAWSGGYDYSCSNVVSSGSCSFLNGVCGYVEPPRCTGTAGCTPPYTSSCRGGTYFVTTRCWNACGVDTSRTTQNYACSSGPPPCVESCSTSCGSCSRSGSKTCTKTCRCAGKSTYTTRCFV